MEQINNKAVVVGEIISDINFSHVYDNIEYYGCKMKVIRERQDKPELTDIVHVYIPLEDIFTKQLSTGQFVKVEGKMVNSRVSGSIDISLLSTSIEIVDKDTPGVNSAELVGKVTKIFTKEYVENGFVNFIITKEDESKETDRPEISARTIVWSKLAKYLYNNVKEGDIVRVKGSLHSINKPISVGDGETKTIVVRELLGVVVSKIS